MNTIKYIVSNMQQGRRVDKVSRTIFKITREKIKKFLKNRKIIVDGFPAKSKIKIKEGQYIVLFYNIYFVKTVLKPEDIKIYISYEDKDLMIINKNHGLVVHPSNNNIKGTLVSALLYYRADLIKMPRIGLVHRIDKETSGLVIIAKKLVTYKNLSKQIKDKSIIREYDVLVIGKIFIGGCIKAQIGRHVKNRKRKIVITDGKLAITHYRVIERFKTHTYIRCWLETGRTHQIRVHMDYINRAVIGDAVYFNSKTKILPNFKRQALHAHCLIIKHPSTKEKKKIKVKMPKDMTTLLNFLRNNKIYRMSNKINI